MTLLDISNRCSLDLHRTSVRPYLIMCIIFPPWFLSGDMLSASCAIIKHQMLCYWYFGVNLPHSAIVLQYFVTSCLQALPCMLIIGCRLYLKFLGLYPVWLNGHFLEVPCAQLYLCVVNLLYTSLIFLQCLCRLVKNSNLNWDNEIKYMTSRKV